MRSRLEPLKKVARSLRKHRPLLLNWFRAKGTISAGIVEGFNNKAKLTMRRKPWARRKEKRKRKWRLPIICRRMAS